MTTKEAHLSSTELVFGDDCSVITTQSPAAVPTISDPVRDVLRRAKELAVHWPERGCVNKMLYDVGGWDGTSFGPNDRRPVDDSMKLFVGLLGGDSCSDVFAWNDDPARTRAEVVDLFDRALAAKGTRK